MSEAKRVYNLAAFCSQAQNELNFSLRYERLKAFQVSGLARARAAPKSKHVVPSVLWEIFNSPKAGACGSQGSDAGRELAMRTPMSGCRLDGGYWAATFSWRKL